MQTVLQLITAVSSALQDQRHRAQFTRWTQVMLVDYLNAAMNEIAAIRPEAFALRQKFTLDPGMVQAVPDEASAFVRIENNADGSTCYEADVEILKAYGQRPAANRRVHYDEAGNVVFAVKSFSIDPLDPKTFYVDPPVPAGVTAEVTATFVMNPVQYSVNDIEAPIDVVPTVYNLAYDFMLGRAWEIDTESQQAMANSVKHYKQFYQFFGMEYKQASAFRSSTYMGSTQAGNAAGVST